MMYGLRRGQQMREEYYPECMSVSRRVFLGAVPAALAAQSAAPGGIDRRAVVSRHAPTLHRIDPRSPLSVGNGEFAFTVDPTGLQTFPQPYEAHVPLCTQSQWGWHTAPNPTGKRPADLRLAEFDTFGRKVGYATSSDGQKPLFDWLRENPHRLHLGRIGFAIDKPEDVRFIQQTLDLWSGTLHSEFEWRGQKIAVETCCHPTADMIAVRVIGRIPVVFEFPYGSGAMNAADWTRPNKHTTQQLEGGPNFSVLDRRLDSDSYNVHIAWPGVDARIQREAHHRFVLTPNTDHFAFCCAFRDHGEIAANPTAAFAAAEKHWSSFWNSGAATDLSPAPDPPQPDLPPSPPPKSTGPPSGIPAPPSISPPRPTRAPANWSGASSSPSTSPPSSAPVPCPRRRPGSPATVGTASSTWKCTTGTPRTSRRGAVPRCSTGAWAGTTRFCRVPARRPDSKATRAHAGPR